MRYEISKKAEQDIFNIEEYLLREWSLDVLIDFSEKLQQAISILIEKNVFFEKYEDTEFYKFLLTKHNSIIYDYNGDVLQIHRILQNFQNPEQNYKDLTK